MDSIPTLQGINSQVASSCSSLSRLSEPPDVGNWFSTYEYRSPDPDSNFSFQEFALRASESQRDAERIEEEEEGKFEKIRTRDDVVAREKLVQCRRSTCVEDNKHNEDMCLNENMDSFSSPSLLSEPPDIRNWFSSYIYDSSVFDTSSIYRDVNSKENECEEERFDVVVINEDEGRSENAPSKPKGSVEQNSFSGKNMRAVQPSNRGDGSVEMKITNLTTANTSHLGKALQPSMQDKILQHNLGPTKYEKTLSPIHGIAGCNGEAHIISLDIDRNRSPEYNYIRSPKLVQKNDTKKEKSKDKVHHDKLDTGAGLAKSFSARGSTHTSNKENDGFATVRKNGCTKENGESSWKKPEKMLVQCTTNTGKVTLESERHAVTKRKALTEATNLQQSHAVEITGKWKCPRKGKPNIGPALKQLRLERWVSRV